MKLAGSRPEMGGPVGALSPDGRRLHLQHGPIDLVLEAEGPPGAREAAYLAAGRRFPTVLEELVDELDALRVPVRATTTVSGPVAGRMVDAVRAVVVALPDQEVTAMAAVAGAVADEILATMVVAAQPDRCFVNNGGDIAFHLAAGQRFRAGLVGELAAREAVGVLEVVAADPVRGLATSGAGGRSFTFGIADAVTVAAGSAALADVAATVVANAVDLPDHPGIERRPAQELDAASDLRERQVTTRVPPLGAEEVTTALAAGSRVARRLIECGVVAGAVLTLDGRRSFVEGSGPRLLASG